MRRIKEKDPEGDIVTTVQPENEMGYAGLQDERDQCPAANKPWSQPVPLSGQTTISIEGLREGETWMFLALK
jgi:hypothetical protein